MSDKQETYRVLFALTRIYRKPIETPTPTPLPPEVYNRLMKEYGDDEEIVRFIKSEFVKIEWMPFRKIVAKKF